MDDAKISITTKQKKYLSTFAENLQNGVDYYHHLFGGLKDTFQDATSGIIYDLESATRILHRLSSEINTLAMEPVLVR